MKVSHEVPLHYLEASKRFNDYDYALVHLFPECSEYKEFFINSIKEGRQVLLDNSAYEICTNPNLLKKYPSGYFPEEVYVKYIQELNPTWFVLPDKRDDGFGTIEVVKRWFSNHSNILSKTIGVVHGHTFDEMQECYDYLSSVCDKLAFSFESWWFDYAEENNIPLSNIRYEIINHLSINKDKPHHLLGCILPNEFKLWKDTSWIETIDTSAPITNAIEDREIKPKMTDKPKTTIHGSFYIDYSEEVVERMIKNAKLFKQYYITT